MNSADILNAMTLLPENMVGEAAEHKFKKKSHILRYAGFAAAAVVCVAGIFAVRSGQSSPNAGSGSGGGDGVRFMHYMGPVLPMTSLDDASGVAVSRSVDYDFSPYHTVMRSFTDHTGEVYSYDTSRREAVVTDRYELTNTADEDKTLRLLYPAELSYNDALERLPQITVNGEKAETALHAAQYSGVFADGYGAVSQTERLNLEQLSTFNDYVNLFSDNSYRDSAFSPAPSLDVPVTVYRVDGYEVPETDAVNPTLQLSFSCDPAKTVIMTYGSNGGSNDYETQRFTRHVGALSDLRVSPMYLILYGEDITEYELQGYRDGGTDPGEEIPITARVTRYETTMDAIVRMIVDEHFDTDDIFRSRSYLYGIDGEPTVAGAASREMLYDAAANLLCSYGLFSDDPIERYSFGMLEELFEAYTMQRIFYQEFTVTVPAGGSVTVTAVQNKEASYDFIGKNRSRDAYELATQLGSTLKFDSLTASVSSAEEIEMGENNFGFDPEKGVTQAELDMSTDHYWMLVRKRQ